MPIRDLFNTSGAEFMPGRLDSDVTASRTRKKCWQPLKLLLASLLGVAGISGPLPCNRHLTPQILSICKVKSDNLRRKRFNYEV